MTVVVEDRDTVVVRVVVVFTSVEDAQEEEEVDDGRETEVALAAKEICVVDEGDDVPEEKEGDAATRADVEEGKGEETEEIGTALSATVETAGLTVAAPLLAAVAELSSLSLPLLLLSLPLSLPPAALVSADVACGAAGAGAAAAEVAGALPLSLDPESGKVTPAAEQTCLAKVKVAVWSLALQDCLIWDWMPLTKLVDLQMQL